MNRFPKILAPLFFRAVVIGLLIFGAAAAQDKSGTSDSVSAKEALDNADAAVKLKHFDEAYKWYKISAQKGDAEGELNLACCYSSLNRTVKKYRNDKLAVKWFRKSADQGNAYAEMFLGIAMPKGLA